MLGHPGQIGKFGPPRARLGGANYTPEAQALFARATSSLTTAEKIAANTRIVRYKAAGAWTILDALYGFKAQGLASLNWKASAYNLTLNGSISYSANFGYQNAGGYLDTGFVPSTAGGNYSLNSAALGVWVFNPASALARYHMGSNDASNYDNIQVTVANAVQGYVNQPSGAGGLQIGAVGITTGQLIAERTASNAIQMSFNAGSKTTAATASTALPTRSIFIGARNSSGGALNNTNDLYQSAMIGASLTDDQIASVYMADLEYVTDGVTLGDSLTLGGSSSTLAAQLGALFSPVRTFSNQGIGGQTSTQIAARAGAQPITVTVSSNQIPASGGVSVTAKNINILTSGAAFAGNAFGTLAGIHGNMTTDGSGNWTFTRFTAGNATSCSVGTQFVPDLSIAFKAKLTTVWAVRNGADAGFNVLTDIGLIWSTITGNKLVIGNIPANYEIAGGAAHNAIDATNSSLLATYGSFFYDPNPDLQAAYNPGNAIDVIDKNNGVTPYTLRRAASSGTITTATVLAGDTSFVVSTPMALGFVMTVGTEYIYVNSVSGNTITSCVRGYAGSTAAGYSAGQAFSSVDSAHFNDAGDAIIAAALKAKITAFGW
jgi:hypothetical protein